MNRIVIQTAAFVRSAKRLLETNPQAVEGIRWAVDLLAIDAFHPLLRTHKLKGDLAGLWSCSAGYDLRIVFELTTRDGAEVVQLLSVGTHDQVY